MTALKKNRTTYQINIIKASTNSIRILDDIYFCNFLSFNLFFLGITRKANLEVSITMKVRFLNYYSNDRFTF